MKLGSTQSILRPAPEFATRPARLPGSGSDRPLARSGRPVGHYQGSHGDVGGGILMALRQLKPYRQGRLDGLCGVYALINALRLLCPRLDEDACERVFCALIQARARQIACPLTVISGGLSRRELLRLIGVWQR